MKKIILAIFALGLVFGFNGVVFAATEDISSTPSLYPDECDEDDAFCEDETTGESGTGDSEECVDCESDTEATENPKTAGEATFILGAIGSLGAAKVFISANNKKKKM